MKFCIDVYISLHQYCSMCPETLPENISADNRTENILFYDDKIIFILPTRAVLPLWWPGGRRNLGPAPSSSRPTGSCRLCTAPCTDLLPAAHCSPTRAPRTGTIRETERCLRSSWSWSTCQCLLSEWSSQKILKLKKLQSEFYALLKLVNIKSLN